MLRRIVLAALPALLAAVLASAACGQVPQPVPQTPAPVAAPGAPAPAQSPGATSQIPSDAVGVVVMLENSVPATLDMSFPGPVTMADITSDLRKITQWTGWAASTPQVETVGGASSAHVVVSGAPAVQTGLLNDVVWPLVAALAEHGRLGIVVMGAPVSAASLRIENRFVTLDQSGGQGVQSFQVTIKDTSFKNLDELKRSEAPGGPAGASHARASLAWLLVIIASVATGVAVYLYLGRQGRH